MQHLMKLLGTVSQLQFNCCNGSGSQTDWNHSGSGTVCVKQDENGIEFSESFVLDNGRRCRDLKRWRVQNGQLHFDHWRQGAFVPLFVFRLQNGMYVSQQDYVCVPDCYSGSLKTDGSQIVFCIAIRGQRKNELLQYVYA